eukprot:438114-Prymnesium_polylepis.1
MPRLSQALALAPPPRPRLARVSWPSPPSLLCDRPCEGASATVLRCDFKEDATDTGRSRHGWTKLDVI